MVCILGQKQCIKVVATVLAGLMAAQSRKPKQDRPNTVLYMHHGRTVNGKILANTCTLHSHLNCYFLSLSPKVRFSIDFTLYSAENPELISH